MSMFLIYNAEKCEYILQPGGYLLLAAILLALLVSIRIFGAKSGQSKPGTKCLVFCSTSIALAMVTSFIKLASLPYGGSITLFSMLFISLIGYFYGAKTGIITGIAYGILQLITDPYIYSPLQVLLDFPLAFGALGLSGLFPKTKRGFMVGYTASVLGRYLCHVLSGYIFFAEYAPEGMNALVYTFLYNLTYILPELVATIILLSIPAAAKAVTQIKQQAVSL
ncbi:MAG: energy-coupled thiamine transporter ThiT [Lachnospiraceae bacterium]|nr:energy-coupled thiamine transporter ThiT [Lachnospiraceae bacterium]